MKGQASKLTCTQFGCKYGCKYANLPIKYANLGVNMHTRVGSAVIGGALLWSQAYQKQVTGVAKQAQACDQALHL